MKIKFDSGKALNVAVVALSVAGTILGSKVKSNESKAMKEELKKDILEELNKKKG